MIDQKYACLINFPIIHTFEHVMLHTLCKLEPSPCFTTFQFMMSSCNVLNDVIFTHHVVRVTSYRSPSFLAVAESFSIFRKSNYCISLTMKHNLEMFCKIKEITP